MPAALFDVTWEELEASATKIEGKCAEFTGSYTQIYTATTDLKVNYKGQASDTFNTRIEGYRKDFQTAETALKNYVQFLREYAGKIKSAENGLVGRASQLSSGK